MRIIRTRFWKLPAIARFILKHGFGITSALTNGRVYALLTNNTIISVCTINNLGACRELGSVITERAFRGQGYMHKLLRHVVSREGKLWLVCNPALEHFYAEFGFQRARKAPLPIALKIWISIFASFFGGRRVIAMQN